MREGIESASGRQLANGRYVLSARLGGGGTADVYRAVDTLLDRPVAIKIFRPGSGLTDEQRFEREARLIAPLDHPGLVTIHDAGVEDDRAYLVLQLIEGVTLRQRLSRGRLTPDEVTELGARLATVLAYVHGRGIVHRDIKPSNVLLSGGGRLPGSSVYLADFGISRLVDTIHLTATGLVVGTVAYMAPEQVRGAVVGPPADMYALGLVLLECLTGRTEYTGGNAEAAVARLSRPPVVPDGLPEPLRWVLGALTFAEPVQRLTAEQCAAMLGAGGSGYGELTTSFLLPSDQSGLPPVPADEPAKPRPQSAKHGATPDVEPEVTPEVKAGAKAGAKPAEVAVPAARPKPSPRPRVVVPMRGLAAAGSAVVAPGGPAPAPVPENAVRDVPPPPGAGPGPENATEGPRNGEGLNADPQPLSADHGGEPGRRAKPAATEPRVVPIGATPKPRPRPRKPAAVTTESQAPAPAEDRQRSMTRTLLRRSWPWAAAGCLVLTIVLASSPEKDTHFPRTQPYTVNTPDPGVSPGAAARKPTHGSTGNSSTGGAATGPENVQVNMPGGAAGQPSGAAGQPASPASPAPAGPTGVPAVGLPSPLPSPPPTEEQPDPSPSPSPCPTKKNGNCKKSHPPKIQLPDLPIAVLP
ncbi:MAG: eukaryotic-like serine/threonine-protein kinase [Cryptosporangiaceae bacterium]|nr:eukaryotic-like serine/threonine-protein kinase [Cryptosporangiaceae bacterium]